MSRAFVNEDGPSEPLGQDSLPAREDPGFPLAAARALLRGADQGDTPGAEAATGYYFGDPALRAQVEQLLAEARESGHERLEQLAERFLRRADARAGR
jgi:DNA-binding transcriptional MerR regulator